MTAPPQHLNFITGNKNKLAEVQAILEGVIELRNENVDLVEIQGTVEEVTTDKARRAAEAVRPVPSLSLQKPREVDDYLVLIISSSDQRPRPSRRHMSLLQSNERSPRTIYVKTHSPLQPHSHARHSNLTITHP